jgi:plasmid stabilization system protein ParE
MMEIKWSAKALTDVDRLFLFLAPVNRHAAARVVQSIVAAPEHPRLGERLEEFEPREVRRILVGKYELRYELRDSLIYVLRVWHTREDR